jgi:hypothetical protein
VHEHERRGLEQLRGPVAHHDLLRLHAVALGELAADLGGVAVGVAVHPPARGVDRRVHDLRVREVGPLGARQVERRHLLEREHLLAPAPLAQLAVDLLVVHVLELPVVVEEAHRGPRPA